MAENYSGLSSSIQPSFVLLSGGSRSALTVTGGISSTYIVDTDPYLSVVNSLHDIFVFDVDSPVQGRIEQITQVTTKYGGDSYSTVTETSRPYKFSLAAYSYSAATVTGGISSTLVIASGGFSGAVTSLKDQFVLDTDLPSSKVWTNYFQPATVWRIPAQLGASFQAGIVFSNAAAGAVAFGGGFGSNIVLSSTFTGSSILGGAFESDVAFSGSTAGSCIFSGACEGDIIFFCSATGSSIFSGSFESDMKFGNSCAGSAIFTGAVESDIIFAGFFIGPLDGQGILCLVSNGTPFLIPIAGSVVNNNYVF